MRNNSVLCRILSIFAILSMPAWAHRPVFGDGSHNDAESALQIQEPRVSQVVYEEITGSSAQLWLTFNVSEGDDIYLQLGVPAIDRLADYRPSLALLGPGLPSIDLPFDVPSGLGGVLLEPSGGPEVFKEPFTGTQSWILLESDRAAPAAGTYYVVAFDPAGEPGKLWVAIGREENFTFVDLLTFADIIDRVREFHEVSSDPKPLLTRILYVISKILSAVAAIFGMTQ
ncbi:MAG: hypothetical protein AMXMBFR4_12430 [Candidatus Hydrogenedentota bacterium]